MQGLILAAGMGKRLGALTRDNTKCMVEVNGVTLIERMLRQLDVLGLDRVVIVVGYKAEKLVDFISTLDIKTPVEFVENPIYDTTNNIYSLALAKDKLVEDDTILLESDLIFDGRMLSDLIADERDTLALVAKHESWMDGTCMLLGDDDAILGFVNKRDFDFAHEESYFKTINIYKFSREFSTTRYVPFLDAYCAAMGDNEYYEQVLSVISSLSDPGICAKRVSGYRWYEIDDPADLDIAESLFKETAGEELDALSARFGGYWRYPGILDFCYLVNPFYPPAHLVEEMQASFTDLLCQYPSGMRVNSLLAAKDFGVNPAHLVVGNGAAELIKSLTAGFTGTTGVVRPTFEEYPNRMGADDVVVFRPQGPDFTYTAADLMEAFEGSGISQLVLINPDNPTGNYLPYADVCQLVDWCEKRGIVLVIDESFCDFADEAAGQAPAGRWTPASFLEDAFLEAHPTVRVVKSISKSFGVPGVRLGVLASGDTDLIANMKKDVAIWNINSFGEYYLQIAQKYESDYRAGLNKLRSERARFAEALDRVGSPERGLRTLPSQANYLMAEVRGMTSRELCEKMLSDYDLLLKDLSPKMADGEQYVRIAVRTPQDDDKLVAALEEVFA